MTTWNDVELIGMKTLNNSFISDVHKEYNEYKGYKLKDLCNRWYCMDLANTQYLRKDGYMHDLCGGEGFWNSKEELISFIDSITITDNGFFDEEDFEL